MKKKIRRQLNTILAKLEMMQEEIELALEKEQDRATELEVRMNRAERK